MLLISTRHIRQLIQRIRAFVGGERSVSMLDPSFGGVTEELAQVLEQWREAFLQQGEKLDRERAQILGTLREGVLAINSEKKIVLANARVSELFGIGAAMVGKSLPQVLRHASVLLAFDRALAGEQVTESISVRLPDRERQIDIFVTPFRASPDVVAMALFVDVTRLTRLERIRRDFMADFTHEVRTPLAGLRTAIETLDNARLTRSQQEKLRKVIARQLRRLERLVEDLSQLDQIESGELILHREPTELRHLLGDFRDDFAEQIQQSQITFVIEGDESVANIDPGKVQQIFSNLVENAIKFSRPGGTVRVAIEDQPEEVVLRVMDQGEGIAPEELDRIFNRFYRIDKSRSQGVPGTGLGLAITKHLVLRHGGAIRVSSQPGKGSTFEVRLPKGDIRKLQAASGKLQAIG